MAHYPIAPVTPALLVWLASRNDPGTPALLAVEAPGGVEVTRADGSALSDHEAAHVRATLAAHRADGGLRMPSKKK
jgi:hypothetical protein